MRKIIEAMMMATIFAASATSAEIVPQGVAENPDLKLAASFLNNYHTLLENQQTEKDAETIRRTKEDGFKYIKGSDAAMRALTGAEDFNVAFNDGLYTTSWSSGARTLVECTFPASITLLTFSDKIDLEKLMIEYLQESSDYSYWNGDTVPNPPLSRLEKVSNTRFYALDKGYFKSPKLKHRVYFQASPTLDGCGELVNDGNRYKYEVLSNMMLTGQSAAPQTAIVTVDKYGYESELISVPFRDLFNILAREGSTPYWGVESVNGEIVKGIYVWVNNPGGYLHALTVSIPLDAPGRESVWDAKMHCYVRLDNLKSIFEEIPEL